MRFKQFLIIVPFAVIMLFNSCSPKKQPVLTSADITKVINQSTAIMVHDVTNPPLAARFFSYICLAGYEVVAENDKTVKSMKGILNEYPDFKKPAFAKGYNYRLSALVAMMETAGKMQLCTVGFTGGDGGKLAGLVDYAFVVPSRSTPRIQEVHATLGHAICQLVETELFGVS